jgi:hypothetical protein
MLSNTPGAETPERTGHQNRTPGRTQARVTVNLTSRSTQALDETVASSGDTQTDVINRAIQVYAYLEAAMAKGEQIFLEHPERQERERLRFF